MGLIALIGFWGAAIRLWIMDGPAIPLVFIGIWLLGLLVIPLLNWPGYVFLALECIMAVILILVERYKSAM